MPAFSTNQVPGDALHSPWPFRADYRSGEPRGPVSSNMSYILRLYDALLANGYKEFDMPRAALWHWIKNYQIPSAAADGALFAQFFEDHDTPTNRNAWAPLKPCPVPAGGKRSTRSSMADGLHKPLSISYARISPTKNLA